jgi:hypothetical protein
VGQGNPQQVTGLTQLYLDDTRPAPPGWELAKTVDEAVRILRQGGVTDLSLDYDLGDSAHGTGVTLLDWLETAVSDGRMPLPRLEAHSGSAVGRRRLLTRIDCLIQRFGPP